MGGLGFLIVFVWALSVFFQTSSRLAINQVFLYCINVLWVFSSNICLIFTLIVIFNFVYVYIHLQVCKSQRCCSSYKQWRNKTSETGKPRTKTDPSSWAVYGSPVPSESVETGCVSAVCSLPHQRTAPGRRDPHLSSQRDRTRPASPISRYQYLIQYYNLMTLNIN